MDPREDVDGWRAEASGDRARRGTFVDLDLAFGWGGMGLLAQADRDPPDSPDGAVDRFGTLAETSLPLTAGRWRLVTLSDDGVRVRVDGQTLIDNWTWHGPTRTDATFTLALARVVQLTVEHFELDGYAVLSVQLEPVD